MADEVSGRKGEVQLMGRLSRWLEQTGLDPSAL
jgi:hypothetical protein